MIKEIFVFGYIVIYFGRFFFNYKVMNILMVCFLNKINIVKIIYVLIVWYKLRWKWYYDKDIKI